MSEFPHHKRDPNKRYILEEGPDGKAMHVLLDEQAKLQGGEGPAAVRKRLIREQLAKKTSKPAKPFTWRLGYNHCIGQWPGQESYPALSGSSLNRRKKEEKGAKLFMDEPEKEPGQVPHIFSARSRGKVKDKATAFYRAAKGNRTFLTLTFIEDLPDQLGVKILNKFLTVLRKEKTGLQYLWVAEHQEETRTTLHFHMIVNRRLPIRRYNALWVLQQYNAGLVGHHKNGEPISRQEIEKRFAHDVSKAPFKKKDPDSVMAVLNPFDIEDTYGVNGLAYYLTKYISKQKQKEEFGCLNWHCSRRVSRLFIKEVVGPSTFAYLLSFNNYKVDKKTGECFRPEPLQHQFFTMVYVHNKGAPLARLKRLETVNKWMMREKFDPDRVTMLDDDLYRKIICKNGND